MLNIKSLLVASLEKNRRDHQEYQTIKTALTPQDGKPINKRLKVPDGFTLESKYGQFYFRSNQSNLTHLIGYSSEPVIKAEQLSHFDSWADTGARERIEKIESILNDPTKFAEMENLFQTLENVFNLFKNTVKQIAPLKFDAYHNPIFYEIIEQISIPSELIQNIHYNKI